MSYLHAIDNRVSLEHKQANKRKFIGIVLEINQNIVFDYLFISSHKPV